MKIPVGNPVKLSPRESQMRFDCVHQEIRSTHMKGLQIYLEKRLNIISHHVVISHILIAQLVDRLIIHRQ